MDRLIYTALAGINERRPQRQVQANDLANVSTVGFKKSFEQALIAVKVRGDGYDTRIQPQAKGSDKIKAVYNFREYKASNYNNTNNKSKEDNTK